MPELEGKIGGDFLIESFYTLSQEKQKAFCYKFWLYYASNNKSSIFRKSSLTWTKAIFISDEGFVELHMTS